MALVQKSAAAWLETAFKSSSRISTWTPLAPWQTRSAKNKAPPSPSRSMSETKSSVNRMVQTTLSRFGQIDYLLNGAGIISRVPVVDMPEEDWDRVLRINLKGVFLCSQAVALHMVKKKSRRTSSRSSRTRHPARRSSARGCSRSTARLRPRSARSRSS